MKEPPVDAELADPEIDARIGDARRNLSLRLSELERRVDGVKHRVDDVKERLDPRGWIENPWARVGLAAAVGFAIGRSETLREIARAALGTAVTSLVHQAIAHLDV